MKNFRTFFLNTNWKAGLKASTLLKAGLLLLFVFPLSVFSVETNSAVTQKPTVCTVTINSSEEKDIFQSYLGDDFNFVELTEFRENEKNWFLGACKAGIECDILVISGHFGGSFFGKSNYRLSLTELQRRSCQQACDGILKKPKEVFLFGCNTTAGKTPDHRTPEEYTRVLVNDGFSRRQAEQISAFRYSPIGQQTQDRMKQVFPNSRIYGFHSQAPLGRKMVPRLKSYFDSIPNYKNHLGQFPTSQENKLWSSAMKGQWIRSVDGDGNIENPICVLEEDKPIYKKLTWVNEVLSDNVKSLSYIPVIDIYLQELEERFNTWEGFPADELSLLESIQFNYRARERVNELLESPIRGIISAQVQVLNFAQRVAWYNEKTYPQKLKGLIGDIFNENLNLEQRDLICSLNVEMDLSLEDLPDETWNEYTIIAVGCIKPKDINVHLALAELLKDTNVRLSASWALGMIKPEDPQILLALVELLKDINIEVRRSAIWALGNIKPEDPKVLLALVELLKDTNRKVRNTASGALGMIKPEDPLIHHTNIEVRRSASWALGNIKPEDPKVLLALAELLKDTNWMVRLHASGALGMIKPEDPLIHLALVELLKDTNIEVRRNTSWALENIKPEDPKVLLALVELLKDPNTNVRKTASGALGMIKPDEPQIHLALAELLKDTNTNVRGSAILALGNIKPDDPQIHLALAELLKDTNTNVRGSVIWALGMIKPEDPQVLLALAELLKDPVIDIQIETSKALREIKPDEPQIHLALAELLKDTNWMVRLHASWVLGMIKPDEPQIHLALAELLKDINWRVRNTASGALGMIKPEDPLIHLALAELLKDTNAEIRLQASWALGEIKPEEPQVLLALAELLKDPDVEVRNIAKETLEKIKPDNSNDNS